VPLLRFMSIKGEGHHFIPMAMEVHGAPGRDMDHFSSRNVFIFSTIND